ncbi:hypothetical protein BGZ94_001939, partial [Podila epigama]
VGGLSLLELNQLELEFLFTTRFELNVKVEELQRVGNSLLRFKDQKTRPIPQKQHQSSQVQTQSQLQSHALPTCPQPQNRAQHQQHDYGIGYKQQGQNEKHPHPPVSTMAATTAVNTTVAIIGSAAPTKAAGRFSIPSPTSPRPGPMSDRPKTASSTSLSSSSSFTVSTDGTRCDSADANQLQHPSAVQTQHASSGQSRGQLLSPPEEKRSWAEGDPVQATEE